MALANNCKNIEIIFDNWECRYIRKVSHEKCLKILTLEFWRNCSFREHHCTTNQKFFRFVKPWWGLSTAKFSVLIMFLLHSLEYKEILLCTLVALLFFTPVFTAALISLYLFRVLYSTLNCFPTFALMADDFSIFMSRPSRPVYGNNNSYFCRAF